MSDARHRRATGLFGSSIPVQAEAALLDRVVGLTGRDPSWTAPVVS